MKYGKTLVTLTLVVAALALLGLACGGKPDPGETAVAAGEAGRRGAMPALWRAHRRG